MAVVLKIYYISWDAFSQITGEFLAICRLVVDILKTAKSQKCGQRKYRMPLNFPSLRSSVRLTIKRLKKVLYVVLHERGKDFLPCTHDIQWRYVMYTCDCAGSQIIDLKTIFSSLFLCWWITSWSYFKNFKLV